MGSFAKSLFSLLFGWFEGVVSGIWNAVSTPMEEGKGSWLGENWIIVVIFLCLIGVAVDLIIYFARWRPHRVWASFFRKLTGKEPRREEAEAELHWQENETTNAGINAEKDEGDPSTRELNEENNISQETRKNFFLQQERENESIGLERWTDPQPQIKQDSSEDPADPYAVYRRPKAALQTGVKTETHNGSRSRVRRSERHDGFTAKETDSWKQKPAEEKGMSQRERFSKAIRSQKSRQGFSGYMGSHVDDDGRRIHYSRPAPAIDRKEAYRDPVYPPQWKGNRFASVEETKDE